MSVSATPPPHTPAFPTAPLKGTSLQYNFSFHQLLHMKFKLQLLCAPGATVIHCQPQPAPLDLNLLLNTSGGVGEWGQPHLLCCPPLCSLESSLNLVL